MESNYNNRDFERFMKQNADQYRMFPSENVWKGIHNSLHTRRRWHGLGLVLLLLTSATVTWVMLMTPSSKKNDSATTVITTQKKAEKEQPVIIAPLKIDGIKKQVLIASPDNQQRNPFLANPVLEYSDNGQLNIPEFQQHNLEPLATIASANLNLSVNTVTEQIPVSKINPSASKVAVEKNGSTEINVSPAINTTIDNFIAKADLPETKGSVEEESSSKEQDIYPMTIESVINSFKSGKKFRKSKWQIFLTPTVTYRELNENKRFINAARTNLTPPSVVYSPDLNSVVTHRPDVGFQLGLSGSHPISKRFSVITGLQFNVSKYDIRAYNSPTEVATIALSTASGGTSTVSTATNYRSVGVNRANLADWLRNLYFSASLPIGIELKLAGKKRTFWGVAGTVQPTYILDDRAWLISTDYKNYAEVPSLTRKWNINTGFETFAGFAVGKTSWRVGPQVRYQTMSSFKKKYPVQEHLFDFGLKMGIMLNR